MKNKIKILILFTTLLCSKFIQAQEIKSTLTQVTTELPKGSRNGEFNWNFKPPKPTEIGRIIIHIVLDNKNPEIFIEPPGGGGNNGGDNGNGGGNGGGGIGGGTGGSCFCPDNKCTGVSKPGQTNGGVAERCDLCTDGSWKCGPSGGGSIFGGGGTGTGGGSSSGNPADTNWWHPDPPPTWNDNPGWAIGITPSNGTGSGTASGKSTTTGTGVPPPTNPQPSDSSLNPRHDTMQPIKQDCDTIRMTRDSLLSKHFDSLNKLPEMATCRDSCYNGIGEYGFSSYDSAGFHKAFDHNAGDSIKGYNTTGPVWTADTTLGAAHKNVTAFTHSHNKWLDAYPEPFDVFGLIKRRVYCIKPFCYPNDYNQAFFICGDTVIDLALHITDTTNADLFFMKYFYDTIKHKAVWDSAVTFDTLQDGTRNPSWSKTFTGFKNQDSISLGLGFERAYNFLEQKGYPQKLLNTYAQVFILESRNAGVKIKQRVDGKFKELSCDYTIDPATGRIIDIIIKICK